MNTSERIVPRGRPASLSLALHLLTHEAFAVYLRHLAPGGVLAVHISNTHLDLTPVVWAAAEAYGLDASLITNDDDLRHLTYTSEWVLLTRDLAFLLTPAIAERSQELDDGAERVPWTDDHTSLFPLIW